MNQDMNEGQSGSHWPHEQWRGQRLYRSRSNRMIAGVCGGLAELTGIDANLFRLLWLLAIFLGGSGLVAYIIMAIVIPERPVGEEIMDARYTEHWQKASRSGMIIIGAVVIVIGLALLVNAMGWLPVGYYWRLFWRLLWPMALIALGILVIVGAFWGERDWWRAIRLPATGKPLGRSRTNRMIAGVCGGLAEYLNIDPSLVRIIWALGTLGTMGTGILAYIVAMLVLPEV